MQVTGSQSWPQPQTVSSDAPVQAQIGMLQSAVGGLDELLGELRSRLSPVLQPESDKEQTSRVAAGFGESPIEHGIGVERDRVDYMAGRVRDLLSRLRV